MLTIDGHGLSLADLAAFLRPRPSEVRLADAARERMVRSRKTVEDILARGEVVYGINTGFGRLKNKRIDDASLERLQRNLLLSHCAGVGPPTEPAIVKIALLLRANALAHGHSGIRPEVVDLLLACLNRDVLPVVPEQGSVGASGDLAPLAHMAALLIGEGEATFEGRSMSGAEALAAAGLEPVTLAAKEGLALINGTQYSAAVGGAALAHAERLAWLADLSCAMTLEALQGSVKPFGERIGRLRPHPGHLEVGRNVSALLEGSAILRSHESCDRVQDQYSLRCVPQVHGAARDALRHAIEVVEREINSVTDNPLIFPDDGDVVSAGNFHAEPLALVFDYAALGVSELANISERRIEQMVNPDLSHGLPAFLIDDSGVNSGFMIAQVAAAALVSENKTLCHPASVDSIPTSANQEDHVSMAPIAGRKLGRVAENTANVIAIELFAATEALRRTDLAAGRGVQAARELLGKIIPPLDEDRILKNDFDAVRRVMDDGTLEENVRRAVDSGD